MTNPKHTDTSRSGDLVDRLQEIALGYLAECNKAADRIEALEAKLAEKDALLRECGEALSVAAYELDACAPLHDPSAQVDIRAASKQCRTTLTKIKENSRV